MPTSAKEQLWKQRTEWPLALVAIAFLIMYWVDATLPVPVADTIPSHQSHVSLRGSA